MVLCLRVIEPVMDEEREMNVDGIRSESQAGEDASTRSSVNAKPGGSTENEKEKERGWTKTPLFLSRVLSEMVGCKVYLKLEVCSPPPPLPSLSAAIPRSPNPRV